MNLKSIYHININCTNLERSLEFYKLLGFREVVDFGEGGGAEMGNGLRMPADSRARARLLQIGEDPYCSHIDLIESAGNPRSDKLWLSEKLNNLGIKSAVCFPYSKDLEADVAELRSRGIGNSLSDPMTLVKYKGGQSTVVCVSGGSRRHHSGTGPVQEETGQKLTSGGRTALTPGTIRAACPLPWFATIFRGVTAALMS